VIANLAGDVSIEYIVGSVASLHSSIPKILRLKVIIWANIRLEASVATVAKSLLREIAVCAAEISPNLYSALQSPPLIKWNNVVQLRVEIILNKIPEVSRRPNGLRQGVVELDRFSIGSGCGPTKIVETGVWLVLGGICERDEPIDLLVEKVREL